MVANLEKAIKSSGKTYKQMSRETKISTERLWDLMHQDKSVATKTEIDAICKALDIKFVDNRVETVVPMPEINKEETPMMKPGTTALKWANKYMDLTNDQRRYVMSSLLSDFILRNPDITQLSIEKETGINNRSISYYKTGENIPTDVNKVAIIFQYLMNNGIKTTTIVGKIQCYDGRAENMIAASNKMNRKKREKKAVKHKEHDTAISNQEDKVTKMFSKLSDKHRSEVIELIERYFWEDI